MKHFALISTADPQLTQALTRVAYEFGSHERWPPRATLTTSDPKPSELIIWGADETDVIDPAEDRAAVLLARGSYAEDGTRIEARMVLDCLAESGMDYVARIAAPQSVVVASRSPVRLFAATDRIGLSAIYYGSREDSAVVGSSSRLVAAILGCDLDEDAVGAFALLGAYAGTDTPFRGVRRLGAGRCIRLDSRGLTVEQYCPAPAPAPAVHDLAGTVNAGVSAVYNGIDACIAAYPDASLELSGGLDSRIILAALLARGHKPVEALTLGDATDPDAAIAASLARRAGIEHRRVELSGIAELDRRGALRLVDTAGRRRDYSDNCVALGVLDWVEGSFGTAPRFSGQNGELARGFYYPFQPSWYKTSDALARTLVRWRLVANERASSELLDAGARLAGERHAIDTTQAFFKETGHDWLTATDRLYLYWRMQRWVGSDWSASSQARVVLAPFFNPAFISWALSAQPRLKRNSKLLARVLDAIDPELAQVPTATGRPPASMFEPGITDRIAGVTKTARKVAVKLRQRVKDSAKPPAGADALSKLALDGMRDERVGLERVAALPFVSSVYVERLADGADASPTTVGLIAALSGLAGDAVAASRLTASASRHPTCC